MKEHSTHNNSESKDYMSKDLRSSMPNRKSVGLNHLELGQKLRLSKNLKDLYSTSYKVDGPQQVRNSGV